MKKILLFLTVIGLSLASCSTDEPIGGETVSNQKTSVSFIPVAVTKDSTATKTSKNVERGNIYGWVKTITLTATNVASGTNVSDTFTLTGNYDSTKFSAFTLDNVILGPTNFKATSTTDSDKRLVLAPTSGTTAGVLATLRAKNPYAVYESPIVNQNVLATGVNLLTIPMNTQQGRIMSVFKLDSDTAFRNKYKAYINVVAEGETLIPSQNVPIQDDGLVYLEWSSDKSLNGKKITYTVTVLPKNGNQFPGEIPTSYSFSMLVDASVSYSCIYTIDKDKAPKSDEDLKNIKFSFQEWVEKDNCTTCKN